MENYFDQNTDGINRGLNNLATAFARQPYYQAQAQNRAAQAGYDNARADEQASLVEFNRARTADLLRKGALVDALQRVSPAAQTAMLSGKFDDPSVQQFTGAVSALTGQNQEDVQQSMKKGLGTILALQGNLPTAAAVQDPVKTQANIWKVVAGANSPPVTGIMPPSATTPAPGPTGNLPSAPTQLPTNAPMPSPALQPPRNHITYLQSHPQAAADFDAKYGNGAAARYLPYDSLGARKSFAS